MVSQCAVWVHTHTTSGWNPETQRTCPLKTEGLSFWSLEKKGSRYSQHNPTRQSMTGLLSSVSCLDMVFCFLAFFSLCSTSVTITSGPGERTQRSCAKALLRFKLKTQTMQHVHMSWFWKVSQDLFFSIIHQDIWPNSLWFPVVVPVYYYHVMAGYLWI